MMKLLFFFGTRPEAIKLAPLIKEFERYPKAFKVIVCISGQHREMLDQVLGFFRIRPDFDLNIMRPGQSIYHIVASAMNGIRDVIEASRPDALIVQGDTTTTFAGALAAFYEKVRVIHVEAGLRSFDKYSPFPEEMNRLLATHIADLHLAPTAQARENLLREGIRSERIFVVGNTGIDALFLCLKMLGKKKPSQFELFRPIDFRKKIILITGHRRESFGKPFENVCNALRALARLDDIEIVYPVHLNPNVQAPVNTILKGLANVHLLEPLDYPSFVWLMKRAYIILTDSGGVQEEAPSLGKPVLVMREVTERVEGVEAGTAKIVGTSKKRIVQETLKLLRDDSAYKRMARAVNPYGDGTSCQRIRKILRGGL